MEAVPSLLPGPLKLAFREAPSALLALRTLFTIQSWGFPSGTPSPPQALIPMVPTPVSGSRNTLQHLPQVSSQTESLSAIQPLWETGSFPVLGAQLRRCLLQEAFQASLLVKANPDTVN